MREPPSLRTLTRVAYLIQVRHPLKSAIGESLYLLLHLEQSRRPTAKGGLILDRGRWALLLLSGVTCETIVGQLRCVGVVPRNWW